MKNTNKRKNIFWAIFFMLLNVGLLFYLISSDEDLQGDVSGAKDFNILILLGALLFMIAYIAIDIIKTYQMIKFFTGRREILLSIKITVIGKYYDEITPLATGGQPFQIYELTKAGISGVHASGVILIKYFIYQAAFFLYGLLSLAAILIAGVQFTVPQYILFIIALFINALIPFTVYYLAVQNKSTSKLISFFLRIGEKLKIVKNKEAAMEKVNNTVSEFSNAFNLLKNDSKQVGKLIILTLIEAGLYLSIPFVVYLSYNPAIVSDPAFLKIMIKYITMFIFIYFVMSIFPLPGGSGAAEFGFKWFLGSFFLSGSVSIAIILWRGITYYMPIFVGFIVVIKDILKKFRFKENS